MQKIIAARRAAMLWLEANHRTIMEELLEERACKIQSKPKTAQWLQSCSRAGIRALDCVSLDCLLPE